MKPWLFVSMPMNGLEEEEIAEKMSEYVDAFKDRFNVSSTLFTDSDFNVFTTDTLDLTHYSGAVIQHIPISYLAMSLAIMATCDAAFFAKGWEDARGCRIEHAVAEAYGLELIYE